jgi:hypothetical protein
LLVQPFIRTAVALAVALQNVRINHSGVDTYVYQDFLHSTYVITVFEQMQVGVYEKELQQRVRRAGGKWNAGKRVWEIRYDRAVGLRVTDRLVKKRGL